jgi:exopolysaccharide production protein ExoQ
MTISLTPRAWSSLHPIAPSRVERVVAIVTIFSYVAQMPTEWFKVAGRPELSHAFPGYYELIFRTVLLFLAWSTAGWNLSSLVTAMRLEPLLPVLLCWVLASSLWSSVPSETFRNAGYLLIVIGFGFWLAIRFPLSTIISLASFAMVGVVIMQFVFVFGMGRFGSAQGKWDGTLDNKNMMGRMLALVVLLLMIGARTHRKYRSLFWTFTIAAIALTVGSNSKTGLVAALAMPCLAAAFAAFRARRTLYGAIAVSAVVGAGLVTWVGIVNRPEIATALGKDPHLTGRTELWSALLIEIRRRPLLGFGYTGYFRGFDGPSRVVAERIGWVPGHAHNAFFQMMLEVGLVGFLVVLAITIRLIVRGARVVRFYDGTVGLFPLLYVMLTLTVSISEFGILRADGIMLFLVPACIGAARGRKDVLSFELAQSRVLRRPVLPAAFPLLISTSSAASGPAS